MVWHAIGVYGWPESGNKHQTWSLMRQLCRGVNVPILMFGDFNEITSLSKKFGGVVRGERQMDAFRGAIDDCGLVDLVFKGNIFTWQRGLSTKTLVKERLDRCLANSGWCSLFPYSEVVHLPIHKSDHALVLLKFGKDKTRYKKGKLFRFESLGYQMVNVKLW